MSFMTPITSVSPAVNLPDLNQASVQVGKHTYEVFSPKKASTMMLFTCFSALVDKVLNELIEHTDTKRANPPPPVLGVTPGFKVGIKASTESINHHAQQQLEWCEPKGGTLAAKQIQNLSTLGLSVDDVKGCTKMAKVLALSFFKEKEVTFLYSCTKKNVQDWVMQTTLDSAGHMYRFAGSKKSEGPVTFTDDDLKAFGISKDAILLKPSEMSCLGFALLRMRELKGKKVVFQSNSSEVLKNLFQYLGQWHYQAVSSSEEGDLVVYMTDNNAPTHAGVMAKEGKVHSKLGIKCSHSYLHGLFHVPPNYGRKVVFFRKPAE